MRILKGAFTRRWIIYLAQFGKRPRGNVIPSDSFNLYIFGLRFFGEEFTTRNLGHMPLTWVLRFRLLFPLHFTRNDSPLE